MAAHLNSFEASLLFAVGVLMAHVTQTHGVLVDVLAVTFVVARVLYLLFYWADLHWQRSLVWGVGFLCSLLLMLSPAL
ncbi:MAPEG family protein [compost metagenome]